MSSMSTEASNDMMSSPVLFSESSKFHVQNDGLTQRRRWLVVDFDGTCTTHDTTPLLPKLASFAARSRSSLSIPNESPNEISEHKSEKRDEFDHENDLQRRLSQFEKLENEFLKRYSDAKSALLDGEQKNERLQSIHDVLDALDEPSTIVTRMVSDSRVLHGLGHVDSSELEQMLNIKGVSERNTDLTKGLESRERIEVHLRPGCETTLARIILSHSTPHPTPQERELTSQSTCLGWSLAVLSINWCPALIEATLVQPVLRKKRSLLNQQHCDTEVPIWSNNVNEEGVVTLHVPGALAKQSRIIQLRKHLERMHDNLVNEKAPSKHLIVYVGDSSTDLAALLEADIGIIMGYSSSTNIIAKSWGIEIISLQDRHEHGFGFELNKVASHEVKRILWQVESWYEINEMLEELDLQWK